MTRVHVIDRVRVEADVTTAKALAYVRKLLPTWTERPTEPTTTGPGPFADNDPRPVWTEFSDPEKVDGPIWVPMRDTARDFPRRFAELCDEIVSLGLAALAQPSDVLRAIAAESETPVGTRPAPVPPETIPTTTSSDPSDEPPDSTDTPHAASCGCKACGGTAYGVTLASEEPGDRQAVSAPEIR